MGDPEHICETVHGTAVSVAGRVVLIRGPSGSGKSALALELLAFGGDIGLIADDRVTLTRNGHEVEARCPETIRGKIEARFVGILAAHPADPAPVALVIDMGVSEEQRLPEAREVLLLGKPVPLLHNPGTGYFPAAILQYLRAGRLH